MAPSSPTWTGTQLPSFCLMGISFLCFSQTQRHVFNSPVASSRSSSTVALARSQPGPWGQAASRA